MRSRRSARPILHACSKCECQGSKLSKVSATITAGGGLLPMKDLEIDPRPLKGTVMTRALRLSASTKVLITNTIV